MRASRLIAGTAALLFLLSFTVACDRDDDDASGSEPEESGGRDVGEIMLLTQTRHLKLWFAGEAGNWPLASYEAEEIGEGFEDLVRLHLEHKGSARPLSELVPEFTAGPMATLQRATKAESKAGFEAAFDGLTAACNGCHAAAAVPFNVLERPSTNPFSNQRFDPTQ
jgi:hypothetical protein